MALEDIFNIAVRHQHDGRFSEAERLYRQILVELPAAEIFNNLALVLQSQGRVEEALEAFGRAVDVRSDYVQGYLNLGHLLMKLGRFSDAAPPLKRALDLNPGSFDALNALGTVSLELDDTRSAIALYQRALDLNPASIEALNNLGVALQRLGRLTEAVSVFQRALDKDEKNLEVAHNLAGALIAQKMFDEAISILRDVVKREPGFSAAVGSLGTALKETGDIDSAIACYRKSLAISPDLGTTCNLVYATHFHGGFDVAAIRAEHDRFNRDYGLPLAGERLPHTNDRDPNRRLRVGYVSPDFRFHSVGRFMLPLLKNHNRDQFTIVCYDNARQPDTMTRRIRDQSNVWREVSSLSDNQLTSLIREDEIDILIDLTAHMDRNRMLVFARKPAPVQITYLAYCSTTGLETMDYRISDPYLDPADRSPDAYVEQTLTLPSTYWCFEPVNDAISPAPLPMLQNGHVTFGCLNNFAKVTPQTLDAWFELLHRVSRSKCNCLAP